MTEIQYPYVTRGEHVKKGDVLEGDITVITSPRVEGDEYQVGYVSAEGTGTMTYLGSTEITICGNRLDVVLAAERQQFVNLATQQLQMLRYLGSGDAILATPLHDGSGVAIHVVKTELGEAATYHYTSPDGDLDSEDILDDVISLLRDAAVLREKLLRSLTGESYEDGSEQLSAADLAILRATEEQMPS